MTKRKFYRQVYMVTVLSEKPILFDDLADVHHAITDGNCVGTVEQAEPDLLTGKQMAQALIDADSDPGFFGLDHDGNDEE